MATLRQARRKYSKNKWAHRRLLIPPHNVDPQRGDDVRALQVALNQRLKALKRPGVKVDGQAGRHTISMAREVARCLGIGLRGPGISVYAQHLIRHPALRTPLQKKRGELYRKAHPASNRVKVVGNKATGGNARERVVGASMEAAHLYYTGRSHRFYSQAGRWTVSHGVTGEVAGERSDCSEFVTSMAWSADAPDPNGSNFTGGFTGSLEAHCREIRRDELLPGDLVLYGPRGATHHVEEWVGSGDGKTSYADLARRGSPFRDRTIGHGSPPVDYGDIDMIAGARFFRAPYDH